MKKKILLTYTHYSTFVKQDDEFLSEEFDVVKYPFNVSKNGFVLLWSFLKQAVFLLFKGFKYDLVYIWFADFHSLLPILIAKLYRKKSYLVIGGYDVARMPEFNYGVFVKKYRGFFAIQSMKKCTANLAVSSHVQRKVKAIAPKANTLMIYNSSPLTEIANESDQTKDDIVLTVAKVDSRQTYFIKGIDRFIETAKRLPAVQFIIIGLDREKLDALMQDLPSNLTIHSFLSHKELVNYYKKAKIYCQLSRSESFSLALLESITFGCIPVITHVGGMPEIIGNNNHSTSDDISSITETIHQKIKSDSYDNKILLNRIYCLFSQLRRKEDLFQLLLKQ